MTFLSKKTISTSNTTTPKIALGRSAPPDSGSPSLPSSEGDAAERPDPTRPVLTPEERLERKRRANRKYTHRRDINGWNTNAGRRYHKCHVLTDSQINTVLKLSARGKSQADIAEQLGVSQSTVSRLLERYPDTSGIAIARLRSAAEKMAENLIEAAQKAAEKGNADAALEVLDRLDILVAKAKTTNPLGEAKVMVVVGALPGTPQSLGALPPAIADGTVIAPSEPERSPE